MPTSSLSRRAFGFLWRRRRRIIGGVLAALALGYATAFTYVEHVAQSPADQAVVLPDGARLAYLRSGVSANDVAAPVILIHGAPADAGCWSKVIADLRGEVYAVDRLGYGNSSEGRVLTLDAHAAAIHALARSLDRPPVIVGHSYGGPVALRYAASYPDDCAGVVLVASATDPRMQDAQRLRRGVDALGPIVPRAWSNANAELLALTAENGLLAGDLHRVRAPVSVIHGAWDPVCPADDTIAYLRQALATCAVQVHRLPRTGHNLHRQRPALVASEIRRLSETPCIDVAPGDPYR